MNKTTIVGWTQKNAFSGVIDGKQIDSPAKIILQLEQEVNNNPECHGKMVDTIKIPIENAKALNKGSDDFNNFIGCDVILQYQVFNGRQQLVDILVLNNDGTIHQCSTSRDIGGKK